MRAVVVRMVVWELLRTAKNFWKQHYHGLESRYRPVKPVVRRTSIHNCRGDCGLHSSGQFRNSRRLPGFQTTRNVGINRLRRTVRPSSREVRSFDKRLLPTWRNTRRRRSRYQKNVQFTRADGWPYSFLGGREGNYRELRHSRPRKNYQEVVIRNASGPDASRRGKIHNGKVGRCSIGGTRQRDFRKLPTSMTMGFRECGFGQAAIPTIRNTKIKPERWSCCFFIGTEFRGKAFWTAT